MILSGCWNKKEENMVITRPCFNSLCPNCVIWRHRSGSTSAQVMACCLMLLQVADQMISIEAYQQSEKAYLLPAARVMPIFCRMASKSLLVWRCTAAVLLSFCIAFRWLLWLCNARAYIMPVVNVVYTISQWRGLHTAVMGLNTRGRHR